jgi:hypothetical protein
MQHLRLSAYTNFVPTFFMQFFIPNQGTGWVVYFFMQFFIPNQGTGWVVYFARQLEDLYIVIHKSKVPW